MTAINSPRYPSTQRPFIRGAIAVALGAVALISTSSARAGVICRSLFDQSEVRRSPIFNDKGVPGKRVFSFMHDLPDGRRVAVQAVKPGKRGWPTLVMLPGVHRGLLPSEPAPKGLIKAGFGFVSVNFSVQPFSVVALEGDRLKEFRRRRIGLGDYVDEIEGALDVVRSELGLTDLVPVSLSYTGAVTPLLTDYPVIIETAPLTSLAAKSPELAKTISLLRSGELFNPIFGPGITRNILDTAYRKEWEKEADREISLFKLPRRYKDDFIEGFTKMSGAVESVRWRARDLPQGTKRVFILAGEEEPGLLAHQLETFRELLVDGREALLFVVQGSEHAVSVDQPEAYVRAMKMIFDKKRDLRSGIVLLDHDTRVAPEISTGEAAIEAIDSLLNRARQ